MKKKVLSLFMATLMLGSFAACGGGGGSSGSSKKTVIECLNFNGGVGQEWLDNAAKRFEKLKENEIYEDGKVGVDIDVDSEIDLRENTMNTSGYNIYFNEKGMSPAELYQKGYLLNINDIVTSDL